MHAAVSASNAQIVEGRHSDWIFATRSLMMAVSITSGIHPFTAMELFLLLLEAGVALALLLGIVWWTWPRARKKDEDGNP